MFSTVVLEGASSSSLKCDGNAVCVERERFAVDAAFDAGDGSRHGVQVILRQRLQYFHFRLLKIIDTDLIRPHYLPTQLS